MIKALGKWTLSSSDKMVEETDLGYKVHSPKEALYLCILNFFNKFIYLSLSALGLRCCTWAFSSCGERGLLFVVVRRLFIEVASLVVEHGL